MEAELTDQELIVKIIIGSKTLSKVPDRRRCHICNAKCFLVVKFSELELFEWRFFVLVNGRSQVQEG